MAVFQLNFSVPKKTKGNHLNQTSSLGFHRWMFWLFLVDEKVCTNWLIIYRSWIWSWGFLGGLMVSICIFASWEFCFEVTSQMVLVFAKSGESWSQQMHIEAQLRQAAYPVAVRKVSSHIMLWPRCVYLMVASSLCQKMRNDDLLCIMRVMQLISTVFYRWVKPQLHSSKRILLDSRLLRPSEIRNINMSMTYHIWKKSRSPDCFTQDWDRCW